MTTDVAASPFRRRIVLLSTAAAIVGIGLIVHRTATGPIGDVAGDALYAVLVYVLVAAALPRSRPVRSGLISFVLCLGVELLQLTGLTREWAAAFPPIGLVLGTGFDPRDLVVYAAAVLSASLVDAEASRRRRT